MDPYNFFLTNWFSPNFKLVLDIIKIKAKKLLPFIQLLIWDILKKKPWELQNVDGFSSKNESTAMRKRESYFKAFVDISAAAEVKNGCLHS